MPTVINFFNPRSYAEFVSISICNCALKPQRGLDFGDFIKSIDPHIYTAWDRRFEISKRALLFFGTLGVTTGTRTREGGSKVAIVTPNGKAGDEARKV